jgi:hypothetical protein
MTDEKHDDEKHDDEKHEKHDPSCILPLPSESKVAP